MPKYGSSGHGQARGGAPALHLRHRSLGERAEVEAAIRQTRKFMPSLPCLLIKRISCGRGPPRSTCLVQDGRPDIRAEEPKIRGLEQGWAATVPAASSRVAAGSRSQSRLRSRNQCPGQPSLRSTPSQAAGLRVAWLRSDRSLTTLYILVCFPTGRIRQINVYLLVPW